MLPNSQKIPKFRPKKSKKSKEVWLAFSCFVFSHGHLHNYYFFNKPNYRIVSTSVREVRSAPHNRLYLRHRGSRQQVHTKTTAVLIPDDEIRCQHIATARNVLHFWRVIKLLQVEKRFLRARWLHRHASWPPTRHHRSLRLPSQQQFHQYKSAWHRRK